MSNQPHHSKPDSEKKVPLWNFNYWISWLFLQNSRLTLLCLFFLVAVGVFSGLNLKTTGFPNPEIPFAIVQTVYPGASSEKVVDEITIPLEGAIKNVSGVTRFNSRSNNSFSSITVYIDEKEDVDSVRNKIDSAVKAIVLPESSESPKLVVPDISGPSVILSVVGNDVEKVYQVYSATLNKLGQINEVSKISEENPLEKRVIVKLKENEIARLGLSARDITSQLSTFGESLPVISDVQIDGKSAGISTSIREENYEDFLDLEILLPQASPQNQSPIPNNTISIAPKFVKLTQVADIEIGYDFEDAGRGSFYAFHSEKDNSEKTLTAGTLSLKTLNDTDQSKFVETLKSELNNLEGSEYIKRDELAKNFDPNKTYVVEAFSVNDDNQRQVDEVVGGIIGSPISDQWWGNVGYLLGGIQLIVLAMVAFVSWRAALVAAAAIPLSLIFSSIYLWLIGEQLNTLVLFSLVLVLGLVVDPALVILEAIQRKIDAGDKGKHAVLAAVKDVGNGIFLSALTNIIVFVPFGVLSGIFGQIFAYIPLTVVPAIVGSYVVPLVFLSWLGGLILKPNKNAIDDEEKNLWQIAKGLIRLNYMILNGPRWVRFLIIVLGFVIPMSIAGLLFSNGSIKQVQFAQTDDSDFLVLGGSFLPSISKEDRVQTTEGVLKTLGQSEYTRGVFNTGEGGFSYYVYLNSQDDRDKKAKEISEILDSQIQRAYGAEAKKEDQKFFDIKLAVASTGGPTSDYQSSIMIVESDLNKLKDSAVKVGAEINQKLCLENNVVTLKDGCSQNNLLSIKVDDGFTDKDNLIYDFSVDRKAILESGLALPGQGPLTIGINNLLKNQYEYNNGEKVATLMIEGSETEVFLENSKETPKNIPELVTQLSQTSGLSGSDISNLGNINEVNQKDSIQRIRGETVGLVQVKLKPEFQNNQGVAASVTTAIVDYYAQDDGKKALDLGLEKDAIVSYDDGQSADGQKFFGELSLALVLAIIVSYIVLAVFFNSLSQPMGILYTIPLALMGVLPALTAFVGGQFGFLEIIGLIILVGIVENVAIFLIDGANQKVQGGWSIKKAISYAAGVRFRPVLLTSLTAIASLAPLAIFSPFYRSIAVVIMFGIMASGLLSLITTPILYVFFKWLSAQFGKTYGLNKALFVISPIFGIGFIIASSSFGQLLLIPGILLTLVPVYYIILWAIKDQRIKEPSYSE